MVSVSGIRESYRNYEGAVSNIGCACKSIGVGVRGLAGSIDGKACSDKSARLFFDEH